MTTVETKTNGTANPGKVNAPLENNPMHAPGAAWSIEWAAERAAEAMRYLSVNFPASSGAPELHPHQDEAHAAAVAEDRGRYLEAFRGYVRCGQDLERRARRGAA